MTVRGLLLALALLASMPVEAASACHRYSVWRYPWAQSCGVAHKKVYSRASAHQEANSAATASSDAQKDIALPFLARAELVGGEPDEVTSARLTLLGYAYGH